MGKLQEEGAAKIKADIELQKERIEDLKARIKNRYSKVLWADLKSSEKYLTKHQEQLERYNWFFDNNFYAIECDYWQYWTSKALCQNCDRIFKVKNYRRGDDDLIYCPFAECSGNLMDFHVYYER